MAFVSEMFDQLRDLLNDAADAQVPFATKKLFLNLGIRALFPSVGRIVSATITTSASGRDYSLAAVVADGIIVSVELETALASGVYARFDDYDIISGDEDLAGTFRLTGLYPGDGLNIRIRYFAPIPVIAAASYAAAQSEVWTGPDRVIGLPVLYAMGMCAARRIDDRQDHTTYSTTRALNGVDDQDILISAQSWFGQFSTELLNMERPLPPARD